jgi:hypothetical protein
MINILINSDLDKRLYSKSSLMQTQLRVEVQSELLLSVSDVFE